MVRPTFTRIYCLIQYLLGMAKIDILIPYWGDFSLLEKAVNSVIHQTEPDWHLYVIDDCYPGKASRTYVESLSDNRITYIRHPRNIGITNNFNYALDTATSPYCVIMGCDDVLLPDYAARALSSIGEANFYQPGVEVIDGSDRQYMPMADMVKRRVRPKKPGLYSGENLAVSLCRGNWLYFPSIVWETKFVKQYRFDPRYSILEDLVLELNMIKDGATLFLDNTKTFRYRRSAGSLSSREKKKGGVRFTEEKEVYEHFARIFQSMGWKRAARTARLRPTSRLHQLISR